MIFNEIDMCEYFIVNDIRRSILPPIATITKKVPGRIGERLQRKDLGMGKIEVDITAEGIGVKLRKDIRHIASLLYFEEEKQLRFKDEPDVFYMASLDGDTRLEEIISIGEGTLVFLCTNPLGISLDPVTVSIPNTIINNGTYEATGIITVNITSAISYLQVKLKETGEFIRLEDSFKNGDTVVIDLDSEYITKNGNSAMKYLHFESDFFKLPVGQFEIELSSGTGTLTFRERWL